jgi:hypothetical protein
MFPPHAVGASVSELPVGAGVASGTLVPSVGAGASVILETSSSNRRS